MKYLLLFLVPFLLPACSASKIMRLMTKSPHVESGPGKREGNKYQQDARYLTALIRTAYPRLSDKMPPATFDTEAARLYQTCGNIQDDTTFSIEIQRFMAKLKDGHSKLNSTMYFGKGERLYSIGLFRENDRFLITNIDNATDSLLIGCPLLAVNGMPVDTLKQRILALESAENEYFAYYRFTEKVGAPRYWKALGVTPDIHQPLVLTILNRQDKAVTVSLPLRSHYHFFFLKYKPYQRPFTRQQNNGFFYKILEKEQVAYLQMNTCLDYVAVKSEIGNYTNLFTRPLALAAMKKRTRNARNFGLVLQQMFSEIHQKGIQTLVLDLRYNGGGDERLGKQLLWYLTERRDIRGVQEYYQISGYFKQQIKNDYKDFARQYRNKYGTPMPMDTLLNVTESIMGSPAYFDDIEKPGSPFLLDTSLPKFTGKVYVLTGHKTFSAAQILATTIRDNGLGKIVGAPTGNKPSAQSGASMFKLPRTKLIVSLSYIYLERPDARRNAEDALYPDVPVERLWSDLREGRDAPFEWAIQH